MRIFFTILLFLSIEQTKVSSQVPTCLPNYWGLTFVFDMLDSTPPLSISMPEDIIYSYLTFQDLFQNSDYYKFRDFLNSQNYDSDSVKSIFRHFYILKDYDPILWKRYHYSLDSTFDLRIPIFDRDILDYVKKKSPISRLDYLLLVSDNIFEVEVNSRKNRFNPEWDDLHIMIDCEIKDVLKGNTFASCKDVTLPKDTLSHVDQIPNSQLSASGKCFQFDCLQRGISKGSILSDDYDHFIIFSHYGHICHKASRDSFYLYCMLRPRFDDEDDFAAFPIVNGYVLDESDYFGFGSGLTVKEFKQKLRDRINQIKNKISTSVEYNENDNPEISVYPNPATARINIKLSNWASPIVPGTQIIIFNTLGQTVAKKAVQSSKDLIFDTSNLLSGIYFVKMTGSHKSIIVPIIISR